MANRYWVLGSGNWTDTAHWSTTSGGAGGASEPSSSDDAFFDSNSGLSGSTVVLNTSTSVNVKDLTFNSGETFTWNFSAFSQINIYGSLIAEPTMTVTDDGEAFFNFHSNAGTIDLNGAQLIGYMFFNTNSDYTLLSDFYTTGFMDVEGSSFDANGFNITAHGYYFYAVVVTMGSGTWECLGDDDYWGGETWQVDDSGGSIIFDVGTSTIKFSGGSAFDKTFVSSGKTYNNIWFTGSGTGAFVIQGTNTFNDIKVDTPPHTLRFQNGETTTLSTFTVNGNEGNLITIESDSSGNSFTLSSVTETISCDYLNLIDSEATGGADWYAGDNSFDGGGNSGWLFSSPTPPGPPVQPTNFPSTAAFGSNGEKDVYFKKKLSTERDKRKEIDRLKSKLLTKIL